MPINDLEKICGLTFIMKIDIFPGSKSHTFQLKYYLTH